MWKIALGFIVFAAVVLFVLSKAGGDVDMSGEKHGIDTSHSEAPAGAASATPPAASAASQ